MKTIIYAVIIISQAFFSLIERIYIMKKTHLFLISSILIIIVVIFCGCNVSFVPNNGDVSNTDDSLNPSQSQQFQSGTNNGAVNPPTATEGSIFETVVNKTTGINKDRVTGAKDKTAQEEENILSSDKYIVKGRIDADGAITPYNIARDGNNMALFTEVNGSQLGLISKGSSMYIVNPSKKKYSSVPAALQEYLKKEFEKASKKEDRKLVSEGDETVDGTKLHYKKYNDNSIDYTYKGVLVKQISYENGKKVTLYVDSVTDKVSSANFTPPSNCRIVTITDFMSEFQK